MRPRAAFLTTIVIAVAVLSGCSSLPSSEEGSTPAPRPSRESRATTPTSGSTSEDFTFTDGASLGPDADVGWGDGLVADEGWRAVPSEHPGRWSYANAAGTCTAAFRGGVLGDAGGMDDREATDAIIELESGEDFLGQDWLTDGHFLRHGHEGAGVAHRQFSYTFNDLGYFMAARAFVKADYSVWVIVTCEGEPVGPVVQEVLSKNFIDVSERAD